ncbi:MAG: PadR family transcriptional regulator [Deltaproteobacteria bacterium]|nr:PadR family transcriptional regulator [Deltaproteobacteria bacterium]MBW2444361.1 PadR family transcriptional regulator [Deltaproteobacteria bacterium]
MEGLALSPPARKRLGSRFAVLGMLGMGLETGYSMKKHVETNLRHFWSASYGRIYPILRELVTEGLATCEPEAKPGRRRRNRYKLTPKGQEQLNAWLAEPPEHQPHRHELLLKLSFGRYVPTAITKQMLEEHREVCRLAVDACAKMEAQLQGDAKLHRDQPYWLMTIRCGRAVRAAEQAWCDDAIELLDGIDGQGSDEASEM